MPRTRTINYGASYSFYLGVRHQVALALYRGRRGLRNETEAIRHILDAVAELEEVPEDPEECWEIRETLPTRPAPKRMRAGNR